MSEDISWRELACRRKEDMDGLNLQIDALHARMEASTDYSIKLQQLIENLKYPESEVPFPELHHHKMIVAAKARIRELEAALGEAKEIVKVFHDMGTPKHVREELWALYQQSPEMKRLNAALTPSETKVVCPDWGDYHNFNAGRCSCGESNAQTSVDRASKP